MLFFIYGALILAYMIDMISNGRKTDEIYLSLLGFGVLVIIFKMINRARQEKFIREYQFHSSIQKQLQTRYPHLDDTQLASVFQGLRDYFLACHNAENLMVSMPSRVVDDAWHEFILCSRHYKNFCKKAFNRFLHHTPAAFMASAEQGQLGMKLAWQYTCKQAGIDPKKPSALPLLFALDTELAIENGYKYSLECVPENDGHCVSAFGCGGGGCGGGCGGCGGCGGG